MSRDRPPLPEDPLTAPPDIQGRSDPRPAPPTHAFREIASLPGEHAGEDPTKIAASPLQAMTTSLHRSGPGPAAGVRRSSALSAPTRPSLVVSPLALATRKDPIHVPDLRAQRAERPSESDDLSDQTQIGPMPSRVAAAGTTIAGRYRLVRKLGEGGMGAVFEAEHLELGKRVAVKLLHADGAEGLGEKTQRLLREARAASSIDSEHIAQVFDVGEDFDHGLYIVMELLRGEDLSHVLARVGKLPIDQTLVMAVEVCRGLEGAHAAGVVHRDLKPGNVFLHRTEDGSVRIKVLDFGVAKLVDDARRARCGGDELAITLVGSPVGTPHYMAPEQAQGGAVSARTDVWALGVLLYECLVGASPHVGAGRTRILLDIVTRDAPRLSATRPDVPAPLDDLVAAMLARDPALRPPSARVVRERVDAILAAHGAARQTITLLPGSSGYGTVASVASVASGAWGAVPSTSTPSGPVVAAPATTVIARPAAAVPAPWMPWLLAGVAAVTAMATAVLVGRVVATQAGGAADVRAPARSAAPLDRAALLARARGALADGAGALAAELARAALELDPASADAYLTLAAAYETQGLVAAARDTYRDCAARATTGAVRECAALAARPVEPR